MKKFLLPGFIGLFNLSAYTQGSLRGKVENALVNYQWKEWEIFISAENIFIVAWKEAQFDTESRLPVSEILYTPGTPLFYKTGLRFRF